MTLLKDTSRDELIMPGGLWGARLRVFPSLDSSNTWACHHLRELGEGDVIVAERQTAGRGRFERLWFGWPGKSLMMSVVLNDPAWSPLGPNLGQIAAVALARMLGQYGVGAGLKWPNDVMVSDRKIAGILVERSGDVFILGIGLNVNVAAGDFAQSGLNRPATSMAESCGSLVDMDGVRSSLLRELETALTEARAHGLASLWSFWSANDWLRGRSIRLLGAAGDWTPGEYLGTTPDGGLRLKTIEGYEKVVWSGDVERVKAE